MRFCPLCATISGGRSVFPAFCGSLPAVRLLGGGGTLPCRHAAGKIFPFTMTGGRAAGETSAARPFWVWGGLPFRLSSYVFNSVVESVVDNPGFQHQIWYLMRETGGGRGAIRPKTIAQIVRFCQKSPRAFRAYGAGGLRRGIVIGEWFLCAAVGGRPWAFPAGLLRASAGGQARLSRGLPGKPAKILSAKRFCPDGRLAAILQCFTVPAGPLFSYVTRTFGESCFVSGRRLCGAAVFWGM